MSLDVERVRGFIEKYPDHDILLFGFTFIVWVHLVRALEQLEEILPLERAILIHGGGWKQLQSQAVSHAEFRDPLRAVAGLTRVLITITAWWSRSTGIRFSWNASTAAFIRRHGRT